MSKPLILNSMGQAITQAGHGIAGMMAQGVQRNEATAARAADREDQQRWREEQNAMSRRTAAEQLAAKKGGEDAGYALTDEDLAGKMGQTLPELQRLKRAQTSGDFGEFKTAKRPGEYGAAGPEQMDEQQFEAVRATYPPGVTEESIRAKLKMMADIKVAAGMGKNNKGYEEGNLARQQIDITSGVISGTMSRDKVAGAVAAGSGKDMYGGNSDVTRDNFSGKTTTTEVGRSAIRENNAQASKAVAGKHDETLKSLTQERILATNAATEAARELKALQGMDKNMIAASKDEQAEHKAAKASAKTKLDRYEKDRDDLGARLRSLTESGGRVPSKEKEPAAPPAAPAKPAAAGAPKRGETRVVESGQHKGKTAVFDGTGWKLK